MKEHVWFTSERFPPQPGETEETNPGIYGKALATWVAEALRDRGVSVERVLAEDWGWIVMVTTRPLRLWIGCANEDGREDRWRMFVEEERPLLSRFSKKENPISRATLEGHVRAIVDAAGFEDATWEPA